MSLITRCPTCATMFKVVPDQLRMSEGWVRCGRCGEVFDASLSLGAAAAAAPAASPKPVVASPAVPLTEAEPAQAEDAAPQAPTRGPSAARMALPPLDLPPEATLDEEAVFAQEALIGAMAQAARRAALPEASGTPGSSLLRRADRGGETGEDDSGMSQSPWAPTAVESAPAGVSFARAARRPFPWRGRVPRALWVGLAAALVLVLVLQWLLQQRDQLAAAEPRLKPWLSALCRCNIAPPRLIEAVAIEGSSFSRLGADAFRLSLSLRNSAAHEVAMPSLELTLTDLQDQPVLRRVLQPADFGAPPALAASGEWSASAALSVDAEAGAPRVAGYRLIAFYP